MLRKKRYVRNATQETHVRKVYLATKGAEIITVFLPTSKYYLPIEEFLRKCLTACTAGKHGEICYIPSPIKSTTTTAVLRCKSALPTPCTKASPVHLRMIVYKESSKLHVKR